MLKKCHNIFAIFLLLWIVYLSMNKNYDDVSVLYPFLITKCGKSLRIRQLLS